MNSGQGDNPALGLFLGILFWYAIAFYILGLAKIFPESLPYPFLSSVALISIVYWTGFLVVSLWRRSTVWVGTWQACEHGVRGGKLRRRCPKCLALEAIQKELEEAARETAELARAKLFRRVELATRAEEMAKRETARLSKIYVPTMDELRNLSPNEFEDKIAAMFERLGYDVEQTPYVSDHGRDAIMYRGEDKILLECKRYGEETTSDRPQLQIFHSAIVSDKAAAGFFVTTGRVTNGAIEFAKRSSITIISGNSLRETYFDSLGGFAAPPTYTALCRECGEEVTLSVNTKRSVLCSRGHAVTATITFENIAASIPKPGIRPPRCSKCGTPMRLVKGKRGKFWGCSRYPDCRSTLPYQ
jgi:HJR/Mrr/RecB family endonuclease